MLNEKKMVDYFWAEVVATLVYIVNRIPTATVHGITPEEKIYKQKTRYFTLESIWLYSLS